MEDDRQFYMELLRVYMDSTEDAIFVLCDEMKFLVCNRKMEQWLGYAESQLTEHNQRVPIIELLGNDDTLQAFVDNFHRALSGQPSRFDCCIEPAKGEKRWAEIQLNKVQVESGDMVIVVARDISARKATEDELNAFRDSLAGLVRERTTELEHTNRELDAFTYSVSHDLRAPLRAINGFSQALQDDYGGHFDAEGKEYLKRLCDASAYMGVLINELLKLSQVNRTELAYEPVDLSQLAATISANYHEYEPQRKVNVSIQTGLKVQGDAQQLRIALDNLLGNAWKYSKHVAVAEIEVGANECEGEIVFYVKDNGCGFNMVHADKLFRAFKRLHGREFDGTGIGLSIVKRIFDRHNGRIWAESVLNEGSTFYFTIGTEA